MTEGQMSKKEYEEKQEKLFKECTEQANKQRKYKIRKIIKNICNYIKLILFVISLIIAIFMIITDICITIQDNKNELYYNYYDKFCQYLKDNSTAYDTSDEDFMKEQYRIWKENEGYGDIIIDLDGNLVTIYTDPGL